MIARLLVVVAALAALAVGCGGTEVDETTKAVKDATGATDQEIAHACLLMGDRTDTPPPGLDDPNVKGRLLGIATAISNLEPSKEESRSYCEAFTK